MEKEGKCPFGDGCSFYHGDTDKRSLIDPLPNLPEGVTLPPIPENIKGRYKGRNNNYSGNSNKQYYNDSANSN